MKKLLMTLAIGSTGGWIFSLLHMPLPWTLGPLAAVALIKAGLNYPVTWPARIRDMAMVVLGYTMGRSFTPETVHHIVGMLPYLLLATILTVLFSLLGGLITSRLTGLNLTTGLMGSIPGGLSQMATICENIVDADLSAITLMQTVRMLSVVFLVPLIALHGLSQNLTLMSPSAVPAPGLQEGLQLVFYAGVLSLLVYGSKYLKISGRYIIVPIVGTAALVLMGINAPALPPSWIKVDQVFVGIRMGMGIDITRLANWKKLSFFSFMSTAGLLLTLAGVDYLLTKLTPISYLTAFIATAPGGMTEMGLTAMTVQADLSTVISFQLFRLLFILIVAIPLLTGWLNHRYKQLDLHAANAAPSEG